jgi:single-strand DNA-binding protein
VEGRLRQRSYETKEGEKRTVYEIEVDDVGPSLRTASAKVNRVARSGGNGDGQNGSGGERSAGVPAGSAGQGGSGSQGAGNSDPWASNGTDGYSEEPPF